MQCPLPQTHRQSDLQGRNRRCRSSCDHIRDRRIGFSIIVSKPLPPDLAARRGSDRFGCFMSAGTRARDQILSLVLGVFPPCEVSPKSERHG
jgi:hypothetical protein